MSETGLIGKMKRADEKTQQNILLSVQNVRKTYQSGYTELEVLTNVNFTIDSGSVVALMGPSGVGKTTLLNLIGALDKPESGRIILEGKQLSDLKSDQLAAVRNSLVGFVFQFHHLLPEFTALENVMMPGLIQRNLDQSRQDYAQQLLDQFGLAPRMHHYPHELSGGEKQRTALARALMNKPALVLADEPTGNLDRQTGARLVDTILEFAREHHQTFIIATHDEAIAVRADRILQLENGGVTDVSLSRESEAGS